MSTPAEQRRAIAAGMAASRAPTGQAQRNAGGRAMIEQRTGKAVVGDINRLTDPRPPRKSLRVVGPVGALPASRGRGVYKAPAAVGGGINSPLTEKTKIVEGVEFADREYHSRSGEMYSDSLLYVVELTPLKKLTMIDANGAEHQFHFAKPGPDDV